MCRNIRTLYNFQPPASKDEIDAAALQYVRKVSGFQKPSQVNRLAFENAVRQISKITASLIEKLETTAPPKDRETEVAKARARYKARFGNR